MDLAHLGARPLYSSATITWYQPPSTGTGSSLAQGHVTPSAIYTYTYVHVCVCVCVCVCARARVYLPAHRAQLLGDHTKTSSSSLLPKETYYRSKRDLQ